MRADRVSGTRCQAVEASGMDGAVPAGAYPYALPGRFLAAGRERFSVCAGRRVPRGSGNAAECAGNLHGGESSRGRAGGILTGGGFSDAVTGGPDEGKGRSMGGTAGGGEGRGVGSGRR